jgi:prepilin-type N-terminal cleavage/methylation domain-containing protein
MRRGATLIELATALAVAGVLLAAAVVPMGRAIDRLAVRGSVDRYAVVHETARQLAIARGRLVRLTLDTARARAVLVVRRTSTEWDTVAIRSLGDATLRANQTQLTFAPTGVGLGLSNGTLVFGRGATAETLTVSRTGRLRRGLVSNHQP